MSIPFDVHVATYFRDLGFSVAWDFDKRTGLHWYEIYEDDKLLAQIDFGASLAALQEDLPLLAAGKPGTSKGGDWTVHCEDDEALRRLATKMATAPVSRTERTEDVPHDRLTRLCAAMTDVLEAHPEHRDERCIVFLSSPQERRNGMQLHGYEDDKDAIVDLLVHLRAIFRANGKDLHVVPVGTTPPKDRA